MNVQRGTWDKLDNHLAIIDTPNTFGVSALEMYSNPGSGKRIGYENGIVKMDIGPVEQPEQRRAQ